MTTAERLAKLETQMDHASLALVEMREEMRKEREAAAHERKATLEKLDTLEKSMLEIRAKFEGGRLAILALIFVSGTLGSAATWVFKTFAGVLPR